MKKTIVCVASGPSLTHEDCKLVEESGIDVMVVNDCFKLIPSAKYIFACDLQWWYVHFEEVPKTMQAYTLHVLPLEKRIAGAKGFLHKVERTHVYGLYPDKVHHGGNSGYIAVQLCWQFGYEKIILLGFDQKLGPDGKRHWFGDHDKKKFRKNADEVESWPQILDKLIEDMIQSKNMDIVNCTRDTALIVPERKQLELEIEEWMMNKQQHGKIG